jgi:endonuclease/exonuclease/phosphatase family metal-dependent hydrolase
VIVRVLTLNLWNINEPLDARLAALCAGVGRLQPDVICLQEVSGHPRLGRIESEIIAEQCGFTHHAYSLSGHWGKREEGLAILSRHPLIASSSVALPEFTGDMARQVFVCELKVEARSLIVANTHLAFPLRMTRERSSQAAVAVAAIKDCRDRSAARAVILCGDVNDAPNSPAIRTILDSELGLVDTFAFFHPQNAGHTFSLRNPYVDAPPEEEGRIDYIFAGGELELDSGEIVFDGRDGLEIVSDHFGLLCSLRLK